MSEALLIRPVAAIGRPSAWSERPSSVCCNRREVTESGPAGGAQVFALLALANLYLARGRLASA